MHRCVTHTADLRKRGKLGSSSTKIQVFGAICVQCMIITTRRVGKDSCAWWPSAMCMSSTKARQWFEREFSWGIYTTQLLYDHWPGWSWKAQHYSLRVPAGHILLGEVWCVMSGIEWLNWLLEESWCLTESSLFCFTTTQGSRAWFFILVHCWQVDKILFIIMWDSSAAAVGSSVKM